MRIIRGWGSTMNKRVILLFGIIMVSILVISAYLVVKSSPENQAEEACKEFFTYEQQGAFSKSWEMLHPIVKDKFAKDTYIQDRSEAIMNYFGVLYFTYSFGEVEEIKDWAPTTDAEPIPTVYRITVSQHFNGKYGNITIVQDVYMTEVEGEWSVLWDYKNVGESSHESE